MELKYCMYTIITKSRFTVTGVAKKHPVLASTILLFYLPMSWNLDAQIIVYLAVINTQPNWQYQGIMDVAMYGTKAALPVCCICFFSLCICIWHSYMH